MTDEHLLDLLEKIYTTKIIEYAENMECPVEEAAESIAELNTINPGATSEEITQLEHDLGRPLPPSFKHFLSVASGWHGFFADQDEPGDCLIGIGVSKTPHRHQSKRSAKSA